MVAVIEWNRLLQPPIGAILFGGLAGVANFAVLGYFWLRSREIRLKQRMVDKDFTASEIERVMRATTLEPSYRRRDYTVEPQATADSG